MPIAYTTKRKCQCGGTLEYDTAATERALSNFSDPYGDIEADYGFPVGFRCVRCGKVIILSECHCERFTRISEPFRGGQSG